MDQNNGFADSRRRLLLAAGLSVGASSMLAACGGGGGDAAPAPAPSGFTPVLPPLSSTALPPLRGAQFLPDAEWSTQSSAFRWTRLSYVENSRMNVARLFIQPFSFTSGAPLLPGSSLRDRLMASHSQWTALIEWLLSRNIYVVLAFNLQIDYPISTGWPDDARVSLWSSASAQSEYIAAVEHFATLYRGRAGIIFDIANEPHGIGVSEIAGNHSIPKAAWNALYPRVIAAVRAVDPQRWLMVEPIWGDPKNFADLAFNADSRLIYSFHMYSPMYVTFQGNAGWPVPGTYHYPGMTQNTEFDPVRMWDKSAVAQEMSAAVTFASTHGARVAMGEFGASRGMITSERTQWVTDVYELANDRGFDTIYFMYDGWGVPADYALGWSFENSSIESIVLYQFNLNR